MGLFEVFWQIVLCAAAIGGICWEDVEDIPNPQDRQQWVVDLTGTLSQQEFNKIDDLCEHLDAEYGYQVAVVIIRTTGRKSVEDFALQLFNYWGVGNAVENDGVLFLIAKDDRKMRIALGDGIDERRNEVIAKNVLDNEVTPRFRQGKFGDGIYRGTQLIASRILKVRLNDDFAAQPAAAFAPPAAANRNPNNALRLNRNRQAPANNGGGSNPLLPFLLGGGALGVGGLSIAGVRRWMRYRERNCQTCNSVMVRLDEKQDDQFLDKPELIEEDVGSVDYDVWACLQCEDVVKLRYGAFFTKYSKCPECQYQTKYQIKTTIRSATRHSGGLVSVEEQCEHCKYYNEYQYSTPRLPDKSSSSSFGSSSSGGGFGGGSSSGGGASGGW